MSDLSLHFKNEIKKIMNYFNTGKYDVVIKKSKILLKKNPEYIGLYNIIGISFQQQKKFKEAKKIYLDGLMVNANDLDLNLNLANTYKSEKNVFLAEKTYKKILAINPKHALALLNYGNLKNDLNLAEESISLYNRALEINNNNFSIHFNKAFILQSMGKFKEAIHHAKKCLELNTKFTPADTLLCKMLDYTKDEWHIKSMVEKTKNKDLSNFQEYNLHFALGAAYEKIKKHSLSMKHIIQANEIKRKNLKYDIEDDKRLFNNIKNTFENLEFNSQSLDGTLDNKNLIFILGMPRSGTTLVEQIISSHSNVFGAGELFILSNIIKDEFFTNLKKKLDIESIRNTNFNDWHKKYNDQLMGFNSNESFLTDKNPLNFLWIGFIKIVFPNAKIIHCYRDPKETCLSIYKNVFPGLDLAWTYNQKELGAYYNLYKDLMKFWHKLFPNYIYDIEYEKLINNQEEQSKALIAACNLKWETNCLDFHQNKRLIKTLSITQARQKIYNTSLNLSKNYKLELKELFSILSK